MLGQHVVDHGAILVALGLAIGLDHVVDGLVQRRPVAIISILDKDRPGVARQEAHHLDSEAVTAVLKAAGIVALLPRTGADRVGIW